MTPRTRTYVLIGVVLGSALAVIGWTAVRPRGDRTWTPEQAVLPEASIAGHIVRVHNLRDFTYSARHDFTAKYADRRYDLDKLVSVWYVLTPFSTQWRGPAHSFVSFGFADSQFVAISVEARREPGETYDALTGLFKRFELMYVVGDERDLIGQRAAFGTDQVYLYPIRAKPQKIREMFVAMLERANHLRDHPEFYNTLTNNCTSNVVAHVNQIAPKTVPAGFKTIIPGYTDEVALKIGLIDTDLDLEHARGRFLINGRAKQFINDPTFSFRIRESIAPGPRTP
jgi:hypothetical protein